MPREGHGPGTSVWPTASRSPAQDGRPDYHFGDYLVNSNHGVQEKCRDKLVNTVSTAPEAWMRQSHLQVLKKCRELWRAPALHNSRRCPHRRSTTACAGFPDPFLSPSTAQRELLNSQAAQRWLAECSRSAHGGRRDKPESRRTAAGNVPATRTIAVVLHPRSLRLRGPSS